MTTDILTSNILNSTKWQLLKNSQDSAESIINTLKQTYDNPTKVTNATINILNSLINLEANNVSISQLCQWTEDNRGERIKNKKDYQFIVAIIANDA